MTPQYFVQTGNGIIEIASPNAASLKKSFKYYGLDVVSCKMNSGFMDVVVKDEQIEKAYKIFESLCIVGRRGEKIGTHHHQKARKGCRQFMALAVNKTALFG